MSHMLDPMAASIVIGGTLVATVLRSGVGDCRAAFSALTALAQPRFRPEAVRAVLGPQVAQARKDGLLRLRVRPCGDTTIDSALAGLLQTRSLSALQDRDDVDRAVRVSAAVRAVRALALGAELAPVFGLAGTLVSLSQLPAEGLARGQFMGAISMAVLTTLYGLLLGNLLFAPLARAVERRVEAEEAARREIMDWLSAQLGPACQPSRPRQAVPHYLREVP
ncbi:MAG: MotA/TolQ/ExbB proton channel family protein [Novosphingobium sp.]